MAAGAARVRLPEPCLHQPNSDAERRTAKCHENPRFPTWPSLKNQDDESGKNEELRQLRLRPHGYECEDGEDAPEERITLIGTARQLIRSNGDDGDDGCANRVEECLHPPQTTIRNVSQ